jgi:hypothetical protein
MYPNPLDFFKGQKVKDISLLIVDNCCPSLAKFAVEKTLETINCKEIITFSDRPIIDGAKFIPIKKKINIRDYSEIMIKHLWLHVDTEFALTIQWDGMAVNKHLWSDCFFNYDYIGAVWLQPIQGQVMGNGGFSLRSRKLFDALRDVDIKLGTQISGQAEDLAIAVEYRNLLESKYNIKYAPPDIARQFSTEHEWIRPTFGFHGLWNIPRFLSKADIEIITENIPNFYWNHPEKTQSLLASLVEHGYIDIAREIISRVMTSQVNPCVST